MRENTFFHSPNHSPVLYLCMNFFLKEPKADKPTPIYLIYYISPKEKYFKYSTGEKIHPMDWNFEVNQPKKSRGKVGVRLQHITTEINKYSSYLDDRLAFYKYANEAVTKQKLANDFNRHFKGTAPMEKAIPKTVSDTVLAFVAQKKKTGGQSKSWVDKYSNLATKLRLFAAIEGNYTFKDMDGNWLDRYCGFLRTKHYDTNKELLFTPYNDNTLSRHITFLFTFLLWSQGQYHHLDVNKLKNPIKAYQPDDVHLTDAELVAIEQVVLPRPSLERARDLFMIGVLSGQRFSDYSVFEKADVKGDLIIKAAEKTENDVFIPLLPKLRALLDKYDWNLPKISSQKFNPHIREICERAGIADEVKEIIYSGNKKEVIYHKKHQMVSSHTARRTFITLSAEKGMPDHIIMKITGIKDPKTLLKYKKTAQQSVIKAMRDVWG